MKSDSRVKKYTTNMIAFQILFCSLVHSLDPISGKSPTRRHPEHKPHDGPKCARSSSWVKPNVKPTQAGPAQWKTTTCRRPSSVPSPQLLIQQEAPPTLPDQYKGQNHAAKLVSSTQKTQLETVSQPLSKKGTHHRSFSPFPSFPV